MIMPRQGNPKIAIATATNDSIPIHEIDTPIPEGLPEAESWRLIMMPVRALSTTKGGIFLPDDVIDAQSWNHQLYKVCDVGWAVFKGAAWRGMDFPPERMPKVGDLYLVSPKNPDRFKFKGITFLCVTDEQLRMKVKPEHVAGLSFYGFEIA